MSKSAERTPSPDGPFDRQDPRVAVGLILCGIAAIVLSVTVAIVARIPQIGAIGLVVCAALVTRYRRHFVPRASRLLAEDRRAPVVFLRQFADDGVRHEDPTLSATNIFTRCTFEERIARALTAIGPVVAIGRPGDWLPVPGAARVYLADDQWQAQVLNWIERAALVVLQTGETPGIRWEVEHVLAAVEPSRLLLVLPMQRQRGDRVDAERYRSFLASCGDLFPRSLPADPGDARFLSFHEDWTSEPALVSATPSARTGTAAIIEPRPADGLPKHSRAGSSSATLGALHLSAEFRRVPLRLRLLRPRNLFFGAVVLAGVGSFIAVCVSDPKFRSWSTSSTVDRRDAKEPQRPSEREVVDSARPRLATLLTALRRTMQNIATTPVELKPGRALDPTIVYRVPSAVMWEIAVSSRSFFARRRRTANLDPVPFETAGGTLNTDILSIADAREMTEGTTTVNHWLPMSAVLKPAYEQLRPPGEAAVKATFDLAEVVARLGTLRYVVIALPRDMSLAPLRDQRDKWRAEGSARLVVADLAQTRVIASTEISESVVFGEAQDGRAGDVAPIDFPVRRRQLGENTNARTAFAERMVSAALARAAASAIARLVGGRLQR